MTVVHTAAAYIAADLAGWMLAEAAFHTKYTTVPALLLLSRTSDKPLPYLNLSLLLFLSCYHMDE